MPLDPEKTQTKAKIVVIINWVLLAITSGLFIAFVVTASIDPETLYKILEYLSAYKISDYLAQRRLNAFISKIGTTITEEYANQVLIEEEEIKQNFWHTVIVFIEVVWAVGIVIAFAINVLLTNAVKWASRRRLNLWLTIQVTLFIFGVIGMCSQLIGVFNGTSTFLQLLTNFISMLWLGTSIMIIREHRDALGGGQICGCCFVMCNVLC